MGSDNPTGADNQQGSRGHPLEGDPLTPQRLHAELLATGALSLEAYLQGALRDGTRSARHRTHRIGQADPGWLALLQTALGVLGHRGWIFREVRLLSGGERSRLELALLGIMPSNLLLLDEPTNHLDIGAREAIEAFLTETPATLLVVSHDRRLLETVCDRLWVVDDGLAVPFDGGYRAWRAAMTEGWNVRAAAERESRRLRGTTEPGPTSSRAQPERRTAATASGATADQSSPRAA